MTTRPQVLGRQELRVLRYITDHSPLTVRQMTEQYGEQLGLARTTVLTTMENLRRKGYLIRTPADGGFLYSPVRPKAEVLADVVQDFVQSALGGSLSPFVAYITKAKGLTETEIAEIKRMIEDLEQTADQKEEQP